MQQEPITLKLQSRVNSSSSHTAQAHGNGGRLSTAMGAAEHSMRSNFDLDDIYALALGPSHGGGYRVVPGSVQFVRHRA
jgi:hypothetical protein